MSPSRPLKFVLDEDVDVAVAKVLKSRGWWAHTIPELGSAGTADAENAIIADDRDAVMVTVDARFAAWRRERLIGRHLHLRCADPDAVDVVEARIDDVAAALAHNDNIFVQLSKSDTKIEYPKHF